jgi:hypothetical protein
MNRSWIVLPVSAFKELAIATYFFNLAATLKNRVFATRLVFFNANQEHRLFSSRHLFDHTCRCIRKKHDIPKIPPRGLLRGKLLLFFAKQQIMYQKFFDSILCLRNR